MLHKKLNLQKNLKYIKKQQIVNAFGNRKTGTVKLTLMRSFTNNTERSSDSGNEDIIEDVTKCKFSNFYFSCK